MELRAFGTDARQERGKVRVKEMRGEFVDVPKSIFVSSARGMLVTSLQHVRTHGRNLESLSFLLGLRHVSVVSLSVLLDRLVDRRLPDADHEVRGERERHQHDDRERDPARAGRLEVVLEGRHHQVLARLGRTRRVARSAVVTRQAVIHRQGLVERHQAAAVEGDLQGRSCIRRAADPRLRDVDRGLVALHVDGDTDGEQDDRDDGDEEEVLSQIEQMKTMSRGSNERPASSRIVPSTDQSQSDAEFLPRTEVPDE